jgi:hypothetical protein
MACSAGSCSLGSTTKAPETRRAQDEPALAQRHHGRERHLTCQQSGRSGGGGAPGRRWGGGEAAEEDGVAGGGCATLQMSPVVGQSTASFQTTVQRSPEELQAAALALAQWLRELDTAPRPSSLCVWVGTGGAVAAQAS